MSAILQGKKSEGRLLEMKADRLVGIIMTLLDKKRVSAQALADTFEVSLRTVYRDMDAISAAGIPIRATPGAGGGFEIMPGYQVDKTVFSADDLAALLSGLSSLSSMVPGSESANALAKVRSILPAGRTREIELRADQIRVDLSPWIGSRNTGPYLKTIQTALRESRLVSFRYIDHHGNKTVRTVEPYQLVLKHGQWYFQGYCRYRSDFRLFRLSRMIGLELSRDTFVPRAFPKPVLDIADAVEPLQTDIRLRIHRSIMDRVLDLCGYERFTPDGAEHFIVRFPFIDRDYYYDMLLSFGDRCECLGPPEVREKLRRRVRSIAVLYDEKA